MKLIQIAATIKVEPGKSLAKGCRSYAVSKVKE